MTTAHWALRQDFHFKGRAPRLLAPSIHWAGAIQNVELTRNRQGRLHVHLLLWERVLAWRWNCRKAKAGGRYEGADRSPELAIGS
jgi:hypothetical protein